MSSGLALDLQLLNEGNESTCVRWHGESIVDLTWASLSAARKVRSWRVAVEKESLSDHRYIMIRLSTSNNRVNHHTRSEKQAQGNSERYQWDHYHPRFLLRKLIKSGY